MGLLLGCDPEAFLKNKAGEFVGAYGVFPGTKTEPYPVKKGKVQVDGMAGEFNTDPAANNTQWITSIETVLKWMQAIAKQKGLTLEICSTAHFSEEVMKNAPAEAKELGCNPDFNAYTEDQNPRPEQHPTMRTAAGHIHVGWCAERDPNDPQHFQSCCILTRQLDFFLGVPSIILDQEGVERRQMYGAAGAFRPKPYGVEYRSLSNFWIKDTKLMKWVFTNTNNAFDLLAKKGKRLYDEYGNVAQTIINENKLDDAVALCKELKIEY